GQRLGPVLRETQQQVLAAAGGLGDPPAAQVDRGQLRDAEVAVLDDLALDGLAEHAGGVPDGGPFRHAPILPEAWQSRCGRTWGGPSRRCSATCRRARMCRPLWRCRAGRGTGRRHLSRVAQAEFGPRPPAPLWSAPADACDSTISATAASRASSMKPIE